MRISHAVTFTGGAPARPTTAVHRMRNPPHRPLERTASPGCASRNGVRSLGSRVGVLLPVPARPGRSGTRSDRAASAHRVVATARTDAVTAPSAGDRPRPLAGRRPRLRHETSRPLSPYAHSPGATTAFTVGVTPDDHARSRKAPVVPSALCRPMPRRQSVESTAAQMLSGRTGLRRGLWPSRSSLRPRCRFRSADAANEWLR